MAGAGIITWQTLFRPEFTHGGIDALTKSVNSRVFDSFESYANDAALQAVWSGTNVTATKSAIADAMLGNVSMELAVSGGAGNVGATIDGTDFGYPAPGDIRYFAFRGMITSGTDSIQVRFSDASDANLYREWTFTVSTDITLEFIVDFYSGGAGFQNSESFPGPTATGSTAWDQTLIDTIEFRGLANSSTFRFDDLRFYYEDSIFATVTSSATGIDAVSKTQEVVIYPVATHQATTELTSDGVTKIYASDTLQTTVSAVSEGTGEAAWSEFINFEQEGTISVISIYAEFEWQSRFIDNAGAGTNSVSKIQMTGDAGSTWVDVTDNYSHSGTSMTDRIRAGIGAWISITAGASQLGFRLVHWSDDAGGTDRSEAQIATHSYVRITMRKA